MIQMFRRMPLTWFQEHGRDIYRLRKTFRNHLRKRGRHFPWRPDTDPFKVLITECLLQRTRADIVAKFCPGFIAIFGTPKTLCNSLEEEIKRAIYPLGLAWRARFLRRLGCEIKNRFDGRVPPTWKELISLPRVGP